MSFDQTPRHQLLQLLNIKAEEEFGLQEMTPSKLAQCLVHECTFPEDVAQAFVWNEPVQLTVEQVEEISGCFQIDMELLTLLLLPMSEEGVVHVLRTYQDTLDEEECEACEYYSAVIDEVENEDPLALQHLAVDLIEHLCMQSSDPWSAPAEQNFQPTDLLHHLQQTVSELPLPLQEKILAYAAQQSAEHYQQTLLTYSSLREHLSPLARSVFNVLCYQEEGLSRSQLKQALQLEDARSLGQVPRSVVKAMQTMTRQLEQIPLVVSEGHMKLSDDARKAWKKLLQMETTQ